METAKEKLEWLAESNIQHLEFDLITPDQRNNWINQNENNWEKFLPLIDKEAKSGKNEDAVFKLFSRGVGTYKDEWMYDLSKDNLEKKIKFFTETYNETIDNKSNTNKYKIKWDADLENYLNRGIKKKVETKKILLAIFRPFYKQ